MAEKAQPSANFSSWPVVAALIVAVVAGCCAELSRGSVASATATRTPTDLLTPTPSLIVTSLQGGNVNARFDRSG